MVKRILKKLTKLLAISALVLLTFSAFFTATLAAKHYLKNRRAPYSGTAHLFINEGNNTSSCSAVVVSNKSAITAAHCVTSNLAPLAKALGLKITLPQIKMMLEQNGNVTPVTLYGEMSGAGVDVAYVQADFTKFSKAPISDAALFDMTTEYRSCGHPHYRKKPVCLALGKPRSNHYHLTIFNAGIQSGMSGGPVFDDKGRLVGINIAISPRDSGGGSLVQPLAGLLGD